MEKISIGQRFGRFTVIDKGDSYVSPSGYKTSRWKCQCECGKILYYSASSLKKKNEYSSCGCLSKREDLVGKKFGKLTVLFSVNDYISPKGEKMPKWHCKCECGNEKDILGISLKNGDTKSCGKCENKKYLGRKIIKRKVNEKNYVGERLGQLIVLEELEPHYTPNGSKQRIVKCKCDCGTVFVSRLTSAKSTQKCRFCSGKERRVDLTGKRFGKLIVISMAEDYISPSGFRLARCICKCDCGKTVTVNMSGLITGSTKSCGCLLNTKGLLKDVPELLKKYDYEKNEENGIKIDSLTARSCKKIWWKCEICGNSWFATIASQNDKIKHGCPYCSGRLVIEGKTDLATKNPKLLEEWDYEKNGDLLPNMISNASGIKVWWKCKECGHSWKQTVSNRSYGKSGCPKCNIENTNSFCEQAVFYYVKQAFPDAINGDNHIGMELDIYIPSLKLAIEYDGEAWHKSSRRISTDQKKNIACIDNKIELIRIREPKLQAIDNCIIFTREDSTSSYSLDKVISDVINYLSKGARIDINTDRDSSHILSQFATKKNDNSLATCYPEIAAEWHPTLNGLLTPDKVNKSSGHKVWWLGKCGHEWDMRISDRTAPRIKNGKERNKEGCPYCSGKRVLKGFNDFATKNPELLSEWDYEKNIDVSPFEITPHSNKKVWWKCEKCGNEWQMAIGKRTGYQKQNCPKCGREKLANYHKKKVVLMETGTVYESVQEASLLTSTNSSSISFCCKGKLKSAGGYHWRYAEE